ncbi:zinc ribbon domain-containing protein [Arthrobacter sp. IA7]|uniref:DUF7937 domain-containing protein n=1 Tax=Arthrobacter ipis TaxID=2716202 RepID=UPI00168A33F2|nr:zinc ribbon domain-containing protein [Arthrobacter ipis]MBD1541881.1 zinc ribbon domain-containing protein [Arthrobacter ipis]
MNYCTNCGNALPAGARFCTSCGTPHQPTEPAAAPAEQQFSPPEQSGPVRRPAAGAFAAVPYSDYVRDGIAALLLTFSMFMVWTYGSSSGASVAATRVDVILISLVSLLSLSIPYLWRAGVFGPQWGYRKTQLTRLLANAPYFILVIVYLILELTNRNAVGPAMAFGLAGAILAAQPRSAELGSGPADAEVDRRWSLALAGFTVFVGLLSLIQVIERFTIFPSGDWAGGLISVVLAAANSAFLIWFGMGASKGRNNARLIGIGAGIVGALLGLLSLIPSMTLVSTTFSAVVPGMSLFFWMAAGALAASPSVGRVCSASRAAESSGSHNLARTLVFLSIAAMALLLFVSAFVLIGSSAYAAYASFFNPVTWVVTIFLAAVGVIAGVVVRATLRHQTRQAYLFTAGYSGLLLVLGLVVVIMAANTGMTTNGQLGLLVAFAFPAGLLLAIFGTSAQREAYRSLAQESHNSGFTFEGPARPSAQVTGAFPAQPGAFERDSAEAGFPTAAQDSAPQVLVMDQPATNVENPLAREASDPATAPERLYELAAQHPNLRALIAGNPATYPSLLDWLAELQDPEIMKALSLRGR